MAHFAQLDANNIVKQVIVISNEECLDANGVEREVIGAAFCAKLFGGNWKQTSYNGKMRKNYAGIGFSYDPTRDAFIPIKPFESWLLDEESCQWRSPIQHPNDVKLYRWDEDTLCWVEVTSQ